MGQYDFDLFTIGAGSGGVRASRVAAATGARVAVAEDRQLGGTCVNVGCVPKKLLRYASEFADAFEDSAGFGWSVPEQRFDWPRLVSNKNREIERLNAVYGRLLDDAGVTVINGRARIADRHTVEVGNHRFTAEHILVATGGRPVRLDIPGAELGMVSDDAFYMDELPERVLIVGGGYIAVEFASILGGLGSEVVQLYRGPLFLRGFDDDVRALLAEELVKRDVDLRFNTNLATLEQSGERLHATLDSGDTVVADRVLFAIGRVPNTAGLGLEELGVELDARGAVVVDAYSRSSIPSIHAIGDCTDRMNLTPVALAEGMALVQTLFLDNPTAVDYSNIPTAVFSHPCVGTVGLTETEARQRHDEVDVYRSAFRPLKHTLSGRDEQTLVKLVVDRASDRVVGAHMVGADAGEIIQGVAIALKCGATKAQFDATIGVHPTAAEEFVTLRERVRE
jgi:glutathione reductase (NADPH)